MHYFGSRLPFLYLNLRHSFAVSFADFFAVKTAVQSPVKTPVKLQSYVAQSKTRGKILAQPDTARTLSRHASSRCVIPQSIRHKKFCAFAQNREVPLAQVFKPLRFAPIRVARFERANVARFVRGQMHACQQF